MNTLMKSWTCLLALIFILPNPVSAQKVALVIANSDYEHTSQLENPEADSKLVASSLREIGFDTVELATNLDQPTFLKRLRDFRSIADGADAALVYFAGHGVESNGRNWLIPTNATLATEKDMPFEAIELDRVLSTLAGAQLRIAVLDACRNNPFANRWTGNTRTVARGLAPLEVDDMLVIYAAAPGAFAFDGGDGNSPFALALARRIVQPGLPVQMLGGMVRDDVLQATDGEQRPFISASMTGRPLFLVEGPAEQMAFFKTLYRINVARADPEPNSRGAFKGPIATVTIPATNGSTSNRIRPSRRTRPAQPTGDPHEKPFPDAANTTKTNTVNDETGTGTTPASNANSTFDFSKSFVQLDDFRQIVVILRDIWDMDGIVYEYDWLDALSKDTVEGYRQYLETYPDGPYSALAKANIDQLLDPKSGWRQSQSTKQ